MSSSLKPIYVWGKVGPNPPKVAMICEELGIPYNAPPAGFDILTTPEFLAVTQNGRFPVIKDPNNKDMVLWESGAIMEYLVEQYDKEHKISFPPGSREAYLAKQWLFFQVSGQGPYYGQAVHFGNYHSEQLPSAIERYQKEIKRVTGVLEKHLSKQEKGADGPWLVGNKCSYADLAFLGWQHMVVNFFKIFDMTEFPVTLDWMERMKKRPTIAKVLEESKMPAPASKEQLEAMVKAKEAAQKE